MYFSPTNTSDLGEKLRKQERKELLGYAFPVEVLFCRQSKLMQNKIHAYRLKVPSYYAGVIQRRALSVLGEIRA